MVEKARADDANQKHSGHSIAEARKSLMLTVPEMGQLLGISLSTLYRWEALGSKKVLVDPMQRLFIGYLRTLTRTEAKRLGSDIHGGLMMGGTWVALWILSADACKTLGEITRIKR